MLSHFLPLSLDQEVGELGDKAQSLPQDYSSICSHLLYKCLKRDTGTLGKLIAITDLPCLLQICFHVRRQVVVVGMWVAWGQGYNVLDTSLVFQSDGL